MTNINPIELYSLLFAHERAVEEIKDTGSEEQIKRATGYIEDRETREAYESLKKKIGSAVQDNNAADVVSYATSAIELLEGMRDRNNAHNVKITALGLLKDMYLGRAN